jgi:hypothetical protein
MARLRQSSLRVMAISRDVSPGCEKRKTVTGLCMRMLQQYLAAKKEGIFRKIWRAGRRTGTQDFSMSIQLQPLSAPKWASRLPYESAPVRGVHEQTRAGGTTLSRGVGSLRKPAPTSTIAVVALLRDQSSLEGMLQNATASYCESPLND